MSTQKEHIESTSEFRDLMWEVAQRAKDVANTCEWTYASNRFDEDYKFCEHYRFRRLAGNRLRAAALELTEAMEEFMLGARRAAGARP